MTSKNLLALLALAPGLAYANISFSFGPGGSLSFLGGIGTTATLTGDPVNSFFGGAVPSVSCLGGCLFQLTTGPLISFAPIGSGGIWSFGPGGTFAATALGGAFLDLNLNGTFDAGIDATGTLASGSVGAFTLLSGNGTSFSTTQIPLTSSTFASLVDAYFGFASGTAFTGTVNTPFTGSITNGATGAFSSSSVNPGNASFTAATPEPSTFPLAGAALAAIALLRRTAQRR